MDEIFEKFNDSEEQLRFGADIRKCSGYAVIAYIIPILFFFPIAIDKESSYCKFHSNQALCWLIIMGIAEVVTGVLSAFGPVVQILGLMINLATILISILLAIGAYKGYAVVIPIIGEKLKVFK